MEGEVETEGRELARSANAQDSKRETTQEAEESPVTDEELRQAMDIIISKFAGNGWKESRDPGVLAIKKGCTKAFKDIAKWLGADKPTSLEEGKRTDFLTQLEFIFIKKDGDKTPSIEWTPF